MNGDFEIEVLDLNDHIARWSKAHWQKSTAQPMTAESGLLMQVGRGFQREMIRAAPAYRGSLREAIRVKASRVGPDTEVRIGPRANGEPVKEYDSVIETGRRKGAARPPYGPQSKLMAWAIYRGMPPSFVYKLSGIISQRGSPSKNNPRSKGADKLSYIGYVWKKRQASIEKLRGLGVDVVRRFLS